ncbi:MAG: hypothetical protein NTV08_15735 [Verrucomicrobia bacterium]|nr:hypothetical protein [Verrucomicrobiota bacterium]
MTARELQIRLQAAQPPTLLHVLPPEVFAATRTASSSREEPPAWSVENLTDHITPLGIHQRCVRRLDAERLREPGLSQGLWPQSTDSL